MCASLVKCFSYLIVIEKASIGEALIWGTLSHGHILPFIGAYLDMGICLVSPFMENGTLRDWRHDKNPSVAQVETSVLILFSRLLCMIIDSLRFAWGECIYALSLYLN